MSVWRRTGGGSKCVNRRGDCGTGHTTSSRGWFVHVTGDELLSRCKVRYQPDRKVLLDVAEKQLYDTPTGPRSRRCGS